MGHPEYTCCAQVTNPGVRQQESAIVTSAAPSSPAVLSQSVSIRHRHSLPCWARVAKLAPTELRMWLACGISDARQRCSDCLSNLLEMLTK